MTPDYDITSIFDIDFFVCLFVCNKQVSIKKCLEISFHCMMAIWIIWSLFKSFWLK